jgi:hypothetical protein
VIAFGEQTEPSCTNGNTVVSGDYSEVARATPTFQIAGEMRLRELLTSGRSVAGPPSERLTERLRQEVDICRTDRSQLHS